MKQRLDVFLGLLAVAALSAVPAARADTVTLFPTEDTSISDHESDPTGTGQDMVVGTQGATSQFVKNRGLIKFDIASKLPAGATITSVKFHIMVVRAPLNPPPPVATLNLHRALRAWTETSATWALRLSTGETWDGPGGVAGVDFATAASSGAPIAEVGAYTIDSTPALIADVTAWRNGTAPNNGWFLKVMDESVDRSARRYATRENTELSPALEVAFTSAPPAPLLTDEQIRDGNFCFRFTAQPGKSYVVEGSERLLPNGWMLVSNVPPTATSQDVQICDPVPVSPPSRFYRVQEQ